MRRIRPGVIRKLGKTRARDARRTGFRWQLLPFETGRARAGRAVRQFFLSNTSVLLSLCIWKCDRKLLPSRTMGMDCGTTMASTL